MPKKLPIIKGDTVRWKKDGLFYLVVRAYEKSCWIQRKIQSKALKNENPVLKKIVYRDLHNRTSAVAFGMANYIRNKAQYDEKTRQNRLNNREEYNKTALEYYYRRKAQDPSYMLETQRKINQRQRPGNWRILLKTKASQTSDC